MQIIGTELPSIVISGVGAISPAGRGIAPLMARLRAGDSSLLGAAVGDALTDLKGIVPPRRRRRIGRPGRMLLLASLEALAAAEADGARAIARESLGLVCGTGLGNIGQTVDFCEQIVKVGAAGASPSLFPNSVMSATAGQVCIEIGARGYGATVSQGELSGEVAVTLAVDALRLGRAPALIAAGVDERGPLTVQVCGELGVACADAAVTARVPYGARDGQGGIVLGEGAAALLLEREQDARRRGARPLARILGHGIADSADDAAGEPLAAAIARCLEDAGAGPREIDLVVGSGRGDPAIDGREMAGLAAVFRSGVAPPLTSPHGAVGTYFADGALRVATAAGVLAAREVFPVAGLARDVAVTAAGCRPLAAGSVDERVRTVLVCGQADGVPYRAARGTRWREAKLAAAVLLARTEGM